MLAGYQDSSGDERQESGEEGDGGTGREDLQTSLQTSNIITVSSQQSAVSSQQSVVSSQQSARPLTVS